MMYECVLKNRHFEDLNPILFGEEECIPGHSFGPKAREYTLIHFVTKGHGTFLIDGVSYSVGPGQAFIIPPDTVTTYTADLQNPWIYYWVGFDGRLSRQFNELSPIVEYRTNWAREMLRLERDWSTLEYHVTSILFLMYSEWFAEKKEKCDYVRSVCDYINAKYIEDISVEMIATEINLDRRYLSRIFKQKKGKTIQEYIIWVRIEKAKRFLNQGRTVTEAARLTGYNNVNNFSKMFKKQTGVRPGNWKNR